MTEDTSPENLRKFLKSDDPALARMGISMAKGAGVEITVKDLEHFLKSEDVETIIMGFTFAEETGVGDEAMEMLCESLGDEPGCFVNAVEALGQIGDARAIEALSELLGEGEYMGDRELASYALGQIGEPAAESLIWHLGSLSPTDRTREFAARALVDIGKPAVESLITALEEYDGVMWGAIAEVLGEIGDGQAVTRAVKSLIELLSDANQWVREDAKEALKKLGHEVE